MVDILLDNKPISCLCDTGAEINLLPAQFVKKHAMKMEGQPTRRPVMVDGTGVQCRGLTTATITIGKQVMPTTFYVVDGVEIGILGLDALGKLQTKIDTATGQLVMGDEVIVGSNKNMPPSNIQTVQCCKICLTESVIVQPGQERFLKAEVEKGSVTTWTGIVEATERFRERTGLMTCAVRVEPGQKSIPICVINIGDKPIKTYRGQTAAELTEICPVENKPMVASTSNSGRGQAKPKTRYDPTSAVEIGSNLSVSQRKQLIDLLRQEADVFESEGNQGFTTTIEHTIPTTVPGPITCAPRRIPLGCVEEVNKAVEKHLEQGHIEPSQSPWAFPIVPVKKKDGTIRLCVDYRPLNSITPPDPFPTNNMAGCLDQLLGAQYFSTVDLAQGYLQVPMSRQDREKTAFRSPTGLWQWTRMPFGLKNSPATFTRLMHLVFNHIPPDRLVLYMDDLCVVSQTFQEHLERLQEVFATLRKHNLKIKAAKCRFATSEASFLGHRITRDGVAPEPGKLTQLDNWKTLHNVKEVQKFLGVCGWWRRFIPDYATIAKPLSRLLEKNPDNKTFDWNDKAQKAFETLKRGISSAPVLRHPDPRKEFVVTTDASDCGIGGTLTQRDDTGTLCPIAFFSRALSKRERGYSTFDREALAIRDTLLHFRYYLLGVKFRLRTDHLPLTRLKTMKDPYGRRGRMLSDIAEYDFDVEHIEGRKNVVADALSRLGFDKDGQETEFPTPVSNVAALTEEQQDQNNTLPKWHIMARAQKADPVIAEVLQWITKRTRPSYEAIKQKGYRIRTFWHKYHELVVKEGLLGRRQQSGHYQQVIPPAIVPEILGELHSGMLAGHFGVNRMCNLIRQRFYWPGFYRDAKQWCDRCPPCATRKMPPKHPRAPLQPIIVNTPGEMVATDLTKMPRSKRGNSYILVVQDYFTKYVDLYALPNQEATSVAQKIFEEFITQHGTPVTLHSDQGKQFESKIVKELNEAFGIRKTRTSPYHPQSDGQVERFNRTLKDMISKHVSESGNEWDDHLKQLALAYNTSIHESTGFTPFFLNHGREVRLPIDIMYGPPPDQPQSPSQFAENLVSKTTNAFKMARETLARAHKRQKKNYDVQISHKPYKEGDRVWLHNPLSIRQKLVPRWLGPYIVKKRLRCNDDAGVTYRIQEENGRRRRVVHYNRLKPCHTPAAETRALEETRERLLDSPPTLALTEPVEQARGPGHNEQTQEETEVEQIIEPPMVPETNNDQAPIRSRTGREIRPPKRLGF